MTSMPRDRAERVTELTEDECRALLGTTTVGRIAFVDDDGVQLVPVNFAYLDGAIFFRTLPDGFLAALAGREEEPEVAFGVDRHEEVYPDGWNVTVRGRVDQVRDQATVDRILAHERLRPWAGGPRSMVMKVTVEEIAGRRVAGH